MKLPWEKVFQRLSLQNRALQLEFQAITQDQANVRFATMVLYAVASSEEELIKKAILQLRLGAGVPARAAADDRRIDPAVRRHHEAGRHPRHARGDRGSHQEEPRRRSSRRGATSSVTSRSPT